jgi:phage major head subunit gpT-like protein
MPAVTPSYLATFETRMEAIRNDEYARFSAQDFLWWDMVTTRRQSQSKTDIVSFLLNSAMIRDTGNGGNISFDDMAATYKEIETLHRGAGFKITKSQMEDIYNGIPGGEALDFAGQWSTDIGAYMAYWPQKQVAEYIKNAHDAAYATSYDGKAFFATDHPNHPKDLSRGTYSNLLSGAGTYAIHSSVDDDDAMVNLTKVFAHIAAMKMPNGVDPRGLRPAGILCGPTLAPRVAQLLDAKFIAKTAGSGAGSADGHAALVSRLGIAPPVQADELAGFESDTTYFVICRQAASSSLGAIIYAEREPFYVNNYGPMTDAQLSRSDEFEWHCKGRNAVSGGHPYLLVKVKAT